MRALIQIIRSVGLRSRIKTEQNTWFKSKRGPLLIAAEESSHNPIQLQAERQIRLLGEALLNSLLLKKKTLM